MTTRRLVRDIAFDAWQAALAALLAVLALEVFERGFVSRFLNPSWIALFALAAALIGLVAGAGGAEDKPRARTTVALAGALAPVAAWFLLGSVAFKWRLIAAVVATLAAALFWRALSHEEKT